MSVTDVREDMDALTLAISPEGEASADPRPGAVGRSPPP